MVTLVRLQKLFYCLIIATNFAFNVSAQSPFINHSYPKVHNPDIGELIEFIDMDNDGDLDFLNRSHYGGSGVLRVFRSNSLFIDSLDYISLTLPYGKPIIADWNNDSLPDIISCNNTSLKLTENLGDFNFNPTLEMATPILQGNIGVADINNDGFIDVFEKNNLNGINLYINESGSLNPTIYNIPTNHGNQEILFIDIENDGLNEMFVKDNGTIYIYTQTGSLDYVLEETLINSFGSESSESMYARDLNNDGDKELIIRDGWFIRVYKWTSQYNYSLVYVGNTEYSVNTGFGVASLDRISDFYDVDQNGYLDIVAGNSVFFNNSSIMNTSFNEVEINYTPQLYETNYKCIDWDNNGKTDILYTYTNQNSFVTETLYRSEYTTSQSLGPKKRTWESWGSGWDGHAIDHDNDGDIDLISPALGKSIIWDNINDTLIPRVGGFGYSYYGVGIPEIIDLNQDGLLDAISSTSTSAIYDFRCIINDGINFSGGQIYFSTSGAGIATIQDIDNDGIEELFFVKQGGSVAPAIHMYRLQPGNPVPVLVAVKEFSCYSCDGLTIRLGDYNLDGLKDIIGLTYGNLGYDKEFIFRNNGDDSFSLMQQTNFVNKFLIGVFDGNGDGYPEIFYHDGNNKIYRRINNNGTYGLVELVHTGQVGDFYGANALSFDFNNDFLDEIVIQNNTNQFVFKNEVSNLSLIYSGPSAGSSFMRILDLDNDGDKDIASLSSWYENKGDDGYEISGTVFFDSDSNGLYNPTTDHMFPLFPIELNNASYTSYTDANGYFSMPLGSQSGNFNFSIADAFNETFIPTSAPYPSVVNVSEESPTDSISIGVKNVSSIIDGTIDATLLGSRCNEPGILFLQTQNLSPVNSDVQVQLKLAENVTVIESNVPYVQNNDTLTWYFEDMSPFYLQQFSVTLMNPGTNFIGDTMRYYSKATFSSLLGNSIRVDTLNQILTCAYDPNDKNITLTEHIYIGDSIYSFKDEIEYVIRFQNTGNDFAEKVVIQDVLSNLFDWSTIKPISASHPHSFSIDSNGLIKVTFDNINLPDSSSDYLGSMGFVKFKIDYNSNAPTFEPVMNTGMIYFDLNPPIYTNEHKFFRVNCSDFININNEDLIACVNDSLQIYNNDYGLPFEYLWSTDNYSDTTSDKVLFPPSTFHYFSIEISNMSCTADSTFELEYNDLPEIIISATDTILCEGDWYTINIEHPWLPVQYSEPVDWYFNGEFEFNGTSYSSLWNESQNIHLVKEDTNGCETSISFEVTVENAIYEDRDIFICQGEDYVAPDGSTFYNVQNNFWHTSSFVSSLGCDSIFTTNIHVNPIYNSGEGLYVCEGENYTFPDGTTINNIQSNTSYVSSFSSINGCDSLINTNLIVQPANSIEAVLACDSFTWIDGVTYTSSTTEPIHEITTAFGCSQLISLHLNIIQTPDLNVAQSGNVLTVAANNYSYQWLDCNNNYNPILNEINQQYETSENGSYAVLVYNPYCSDTSACIEVGSLGMHTELITEPHVYPNPSSDGSFFITYEGLIFDVKLFDLIGREIEILYDESSKKIITKNISPGNYTIQLKTSEGTFIEEVIISN